MKHSSPRLLERFARVLALGVVLTSTLTPGVQAQAASDSLARWQQVDTSSPRDTLRSFLTHFDASLEAWRAGDEEARRRSAAMASSSLDFSDEPARGRYIRTFEKMVMLKEVLDHIELPPFEDIPGKEEVESEGITRWTVPQTLIDIIKIETGPDAGQFLISKETVANLPLYYELVRDLPYSSAADVGLYAELRVSPGPLIPKRWIDGLPTGAKKLVMGYPLWQWATLLAMAAVALVLVRSLFRWGRRWDERAQRRGSRFRFGQTLALLGTILVTWAFRLGVMDAIWLFGTAYEIVSIVVWFIILSCSVVLVIILTGHLGVALVQPREGRKQVLDPALTRILFRLVGIVVAAIIVIYAVEFFGFSVAPLVAGLGVGGLAIALAIRPTLENILGGLTLFADQPVRVGDFCRYGSEVGTVQEIGLRSTRIRSRERTLVTIPNAEFSQMKLENFSVRDQRLLRTTLNLRYETTMDQLRYVLAELRKLLFGHPMVTESPARVRFVDLGAYSIDVEIFAYLRCQDQNTYLAVREDILFRVADIVKASGTDFAFPTQTLHLGRDAGLSGERTEEAERTVDSWRKASSLPFPELDSDERSKIEDRLEYPPEGSSQHKPRG